MLCVVTLYAIMLSALTPSGVMLQSSELFDELKNLTNSGPTLLSNLTK